MIKNCTPKIFLMFLGYLICQIPSERLYITIQMQDQIGIINTETNEIDMLITTEMQNSQNMNCMDYQDPAMCDMMDGCEWMMGMCMETSDLDCIEYENSMECEMAGCMWMMDMCMDLRKK